MAKGFGGTGKPSGINKLKKEMEKTMRQMEFVQKELEDTYVEASSGGGMVKVTANAAGQVLSIKISPEAVDPDDVEMLEDLVLAAVKDALAQASEKRDEKILSGLLPEMLDQL